MLRSFKAIKVWKKPDIGFRKPDVHQNDQQNNANNDPSVSSGEMGVSLSGGMFSGTPLFSFGKRSFAFKI